MKLNIILFLFINVFSLSAGASTYYVSSLGDDANSGATIATAWRTINRVNASTFLPGDRVLFEGGQTFSGGIWLQASSQGTPAQPIVVSSYGPGMATIASGTSFGFYANNNAGIELRRLRFAGDGRLNNTNSGVIFFIDALNTHLQYLRLDSLEVSGYQKTGITISSWNGASGYADVRVTACVTHANGEAGLASFSQDLGAHQNWYVGNCKAYDNAGRADVTTTHTGNGIVLSGIDGALIERCEAYNNGWLNANPSGGPVGIWGWCCNNLVIQNCESHHNRSGTTHDGGGFDIDGGCTNSVLQYNYSHDNEGPGFLLAQYPGAPAMHDLIVRYNVSENDARRNNQGALHVWSSGANGGIQRAVFHNNTVVITPPADGSRPKAVFITSDGISGISLRNNVLQTSGGLAVLSTYTDSGLRLEGNCYWSGAAPLQLDWKGTIYSGLPAWRAATGQERFADGRLTGLHADPQVDASPRFVPLPESGVRGAGLDMPTEFNLNPGPYDFNGSPTPSMPARGNIGASEARVNSAPLPVVLTYFTATRKGTGGLLRWGTATEQSNAYFLVEYSLNGQTYTGLGQIPGRGNSARPQEYEFVDSQAGSYPVSVIYYRLRQVDVNGTNTFSPVCTLPGLLAPVDLAGKLGVFPNPAASFGSTVVVNGAQSTPVQLLDVRGQLVASAPVEPSGSAALMVVGLAAGIYILRCGAQTARLIITK